MHYSSSHKSNINKQLIFGLDKIEGITFHDLYEKYPDFDIDIRDEQELLIQHDCIVFHHPMYWYSQPAIIKEWMDLVLTHGWAYGSKGTALEGKLFFNSLTTGGPREAFHPKGMHKHTVAQLLTPVKLTAMRCRMISLPPFVVHGTYSMERDELEIYKRDYENLLKLMLEDKIDIKKATKLDYLNDYL